MDNIQFGAFVARLRKELGLTQKELADRLGVTDKAVSKWETGKGFPDVKLLEPLAQALGVSLLELMQGRREESDTVSVEQAGAVLSQALDCSQRSTALRYLALFRWLLLGTAAVCLAELLPLLLYPLLLLSVRLGLFRSGPSDADLGVIGGADGPTVILTSSIQPTWLAVGLPAVLLAASLFLALRVRSAEKKLK
ncbi:MAG: helix-turn-helix domain-containing protein [Lawsonibacter sp.]|nr:helix-turn-helix domain-containing protein [Lawsonibacter sp.]